MPRLPRKVLRIALYLLAGAVCTLVCIVVGLGIDHSGLCIGFDQRYERDNDPLGYVVGWVQVPGEPRIEADWILMAVNEDGKADTDGAYGEFNAAERQAREHAGSCQFTCYTPWYRGFPWLCARLYSSFYGAHGVTYRVVQANALREFPENVFGGVLWLPAAGNVLVWGLVVAVLDVLIRRFRQTFQWPRLWRNQCLQCGYDLRGCVGRTCPECGTVVVDRDGRKALLDAMLRTRRRNFQAAGLLLLPLAVLYSAYVILATVEVDALRHPYATMMVQFGDAALVCSLLAICAVRLLRERSVGVSFALLCLLGCRVAFFGSFAAYAVTWMPPPAAKVRLLLVANLIVAGLALLLAKSRQMLTRQAPGGEPEQAAGNERESNVRQSDNATGVEPSLESRFAGALLGAFVGDALGAPFEGKRPEMVAELWERVAWQRPASPRRYTDDTQMMMSVAESLIARGGVDPDHLMERFVVHFDRGRGYGMGAYQLITAVQNGTPWREAAATILPGGSYGNGAAMRVAPVGLFYHHDLDQLRLAAEVSASTTHAHPLGKEGAALQACAVALAVRSAAGQFDRFAFLEKLRSFVRPELGEYTERLEAIGRLLRRPHDLERALAALGNDVRAQSAVPAAIYAFLACPESFAGAVELAIHLGGDTDTIGAMTGAIAGALHGVEAIPAEWLDSLENEPKGRDHVRELAKRLLACRG